MTSIKPIINVQFMRALAALAVLAYHFSFQYFNAGGSTNNWFFHVFNQIGYAGVDFFFVISGYIMWITTQGAKRSTSAPEFVYKRFTRIFFGYWPYFLIALLIITIYPNLLSSQTNLLGSFWLTELNTNQLLIQVAWTLQYELYFYALFTVLLLIPSQYTLPALGCMAGLVLAFNASLYGLADGHWLHSHVQLNFLLSPYCLQFFAGCLMGHYFQYRRLRFLLLWIMLGLLLLVLAIYLQSHVINSSLISHDHLNLRVLIYGGAAWLLLAALIELDLRGRTLFKRFSLLLGGASYSIYLSHTLVIAAVYATGWQLWINQNSQHPGLWLTLIMGLTVIYSVIHYIYVEKPLMTVARHIQSKWFSSW